jgi:hypothetical protein
MPRNQRRNNGCNGQFKGLFKSSRLQIKKNNTKKTDRTTVPLRVLCLALLNKRGKNKTLIISPLISCGEMYYISIEEKCEGLQSCNTIPLNSILLEEDDEQDVNERKEERHPENGQ